MKSWLLSIWTCVLLIRRRSYFLSSSPAACHCWFPHGNNELRLPIAGHIMLKQGYGKVQAATLCCLLLGKYWCTHTSIRFMQICRTFRVVSNWQIPWVHHQEGIIQSRRTAMSCIELPSFRWQFWTQTFQLSKARSVHGQVLDLIGGIWQVRTIRSGRNACCRTVGDCCNHVWNVRSTKGFLTSLVPTIRHSEGCELGDPCKWWDNIHDVDSTSPWLGACRGSRADLQDGTHDVGCGIGHLVELECVRCWRSFGVVFVCSF